MGRRLDWVLHADPTLNAEAGAVLTVKCIALRSERNLMETGS